MECQQCGGERVANAQGKCSDLFGISLGEIDEHSIYVPRDFGIGGGDYIRLEYCLDCGQIQGDFPLDVTELEMEAQGSDDEE